MVFLCLTPTFLSSTSVGNSLGASLSHILLNHGPIIFAEPCVRFFQYSFEQFGFIDYRIGDLAIAPFGDQGAHYAAGDDEDLPLGQIGFLKILFEISPGGMDEHLSSSLIKSFVIPIPVSLVRVGFIVLHDIPYVRIRLGTYNIQRDSVSFTVLNNGHVDLCESLHIIICQ